MLGAHFDAVINLDGVNELALPESELLPLGVAPFYPRGSSLQMARLCEGLGIPYFHFLQPNQYVPDSKPMSEAERRIAWREDSPMRVPVEQGYAKLREAGAALAASPALASP